MGQIFREGVRQWLRTFLILGIPVETGAAKAALAPIGRYLNRVAGLAINPKRKPYYSKLYDAVQSPSLGELLSTFSIKDDRSNPLGFVYEFNWSTELIHWFQADHYNGKFEPGEDILPVAEDELEQYVLAKIDERLPDISDFIFKV